MYSKTMYAINIRIKVQVFRTIRCDLNDIIINDFEKTKTFVTVSQMMYVCPGFKSNRIFATRLITVSFAQTTFNVQPST